MRCFRYPMAVDTNFPLITLHIPINHFLYLLKSKNLIPPVGCWNRTQVLCTWTRRSKGQACTKCLPDTHQLPSPNGSPPRTTGFARSTPSYPPSPTQTNPEQKANLQRENVSYHPARQSNRPASKVIQHKGGSTRFN